jgi:hypothetical protein
MVVKAGKIKRFETDLAAPGFGNFRSSKGPAIVNAGNLQN